MSNDWKLFTIHDGVSECKIDALKFASRYINPMWVTGELEVFRIENPLPSNSRNGIRNRLELANYHKKVRPVVRKLLDKAVGIANRSGASIKILDPS